MRPYAETARLVTTVTGGEPTLLDIPDLASNCWMEYYLCDLPTYNLNARVWVALDRTPKAERPRPEQCRFLLSTRPQCPREQGAGWVSVLHVHGFHLWKRLDEQEWDYLLACQRRSMSGPAQLSVLRGQAGR
jgi:hypothetical protein